MKKRWIAFLLCLCLCVGLCACSAVSQDESQSGDETSSAKLVEEESIHIEEPQSGDLTELTEKCEWTELDSYIEQYFDVMVQQGKDEEKGTLIWVAKEDYYTSKVGQFALEAYRTALGTTLKEEDKESPEAWEKLKNGGQVKDASIEATAEQITEKTKHLGLEVVTQENTTELRKTNGDKVEVPFKVMLLNGEMKALVAQADYFTSVAGQFSLERIAGEDRQKIMDCAEKRFSKIDSRAKEFFEAEQGNNYSYLLGYLGLTGDKNTSFFGGFSGLLAYIAQNQEKLEVSTFLKQIGENLLMEEKNQDAIWGTLKLEQKKRLVQEDRSLILSIMAPMMIIMLLIGVMSGAMIVLVIMLHGKEESMLGGIKELVGKIPFVGKRSNHKTAEKAEFESYPENKDGARIPQRRQKGMSVESIINPTAKGGTKEEETLNQSGANPSPISITPYVPDGDRNHNPQGNRGATVPQNYQGTVPTHEQSETSRTTKRKATAYLILSKKSVRNRAAHATDILQLTTVNYSREHYDQCPYVLYDDNTVGLNAGYSGGRTPSEYWERIYDESALLEVFDVVDETGKRLVTKEEICGREEILAVKEAFFDTNSGKILRKGQIRVK